MSSFMFNRMNLQTCTAEGCGDEFFYVRCPKGHLNAWSRYATDGSLAECDYPNCLEQFWFNAGEFAHMRLTETA